MTLPAPVLTAWRTVQQLPSLDDYPVLRQRGRIAYVLTTSLRRIHDDLRLLVERIERGEPDDFPSLAADVLEDLDLFHFVDEDLGSDYMVPEDAREVLLTTIEGYTDLARAIARIDGGAAHADTPSPSGRPRRRTPPSLREAMSDWDPMDVVLTPTAYKSDAIENLSMALNSVTLSISRHLASYQLWTPLDPSAGAEVLVRIDRCHELMHCDELGTIDASHVRTMHRYLAAARRIGEEYARMGRAKDPEGEFNAPQVKAHRTLRRVPLPGAVHAAWQALQQLPPFDDHAALRDSKSKAYRLTERLRRLRDELSVLVSGLEHAQMLDYSTRAVDMLAALHFHDARFEEGVERDHKGRTFPYDLPAEARAAVVATSGALADVARAIAKVDDSAPPGISALVKGANRRGIPAEIHTAMHGWSPSDSNIAHADDGTAHATRELERLLRQVVYLVMTTITDIKDWKLVESSLGAEIHRLVDECTVMLDDAELARVVTKRRRKLDIFLLKSRAMADAFTKWSADHPG